MLDNLINFIGSIALNLLMKIPGTNFSYNEYISSLRELLPKINYFVPFYKMATIMNVWLATMTIAIGVYIIIKFVTRGR